MDSAERGASNVSNSTYETMASHYRRTTRAFFVDNDSAEFPDVGTTTSSDRETVKLRVSPHSNRSDFIASEHELHRALYLKKRDHPKSPFMDSLSLGH